VGQSHVSRDEVLKSLEDLRKNETIGSNQKPPCHHNQDDELLGFMQNLGLENFAALASSAKSNSQKAWN
jgi:hypothetical protein